MPPLIFAIGEAHGFQSESSAMPNEKTENSIGKHDRFKKSNSASVSVNPICANSETNEILIDGSASCMRFAFAAQSPNF